MDFVDLRTVFARLGNHPGDMGPQEAKMIYDCAMSRERGARFLEIGAGMGRTTVILGTAARNIGARLVVAHDNSWKDPQIVRWFDQAVRLHGLRDVVETELVPPSDEFDLVLITGNYAADALNIKTDGFVIQRQATRDVANAQLLHDQRPHISIWKMQPKPKGEIISAPAVSDGADEREQIVKPEQLVAVEVEKPS